MRAHESAGQCRNSVKRGGRTSGAKATRRSDPIPLDSSPARRPLRILHVIPQFPYFGGRTIVGGHAGALLNLALAEAAAGHEVTILSYVAGRQGGFSIEDGLSVWSVAERARPGTVGFGIGFCRRAVGWVRTRRGSFDVLHCHSGYADYILVGRALQRVLRRPVVYTMYCPVPSAGGRVRLPGVHGVLRHWAANFDALSAISSNVAASLADFGLPGVEAIPPALDVDRFRPADDVDRLRAELGLAATDVAVLFVGNAKPQKNLSGLLRAFAQVRQKNPHARLVITTELAQSSPDHRLAELRREMVDLGVAEAVIQQRIVEDIPALMQACDLLVAPFLDTFGPSDYFMAALEAMACGKPVVASAIGGMPEVVRSERGFLIDPDDERALVAALAALVEDPALRRAVGQHARRYAEREFDAREIASRYIQLYGRIGA